MNKTDLVSTEELKDWIEILKEKTKCPVLTIDTKTNRNFNIIEKKVLELSEPRIQALMAKGLLRRAARVVVVGLPNVGKSSIINKLTKSSKTKTGAKAGVTRQQQWVRINPNIDLLDTPGIIPMKQEDQQRAKKLAFVNSVSENAYSSEIVAKELLDLISGNQRYTNKFKEYYNIDTELSLENIALSRNWVRTGNEPDIERASQYMLRDFRDGKIGKFILDNPDEI